MEKKKIVFISHQITPFEPVDALDATTQIHENVQRIKRIVKIINTQTTKIVPFVPYLSDVLSLDETRAEDRARGLDNSREILQRYPVDEMWLTGPRLTDGMKVEIEAVRGRGVAVVDLIGVDITSWLKNFIY